MKFLDLILQRELATSPLLLKVMEKSNIKSKYLKNIVEEIKEEEKRNDFIKTVFEEEIEYPLDSQSIKFLNMIFPKFIKDPLKNEKPEYFFHTIYKKYLEILEKKESLTDDNLKEIKTNLFNLLETYNKKTFDNMDNLNIEYLFSSPVWDKILLDVNFEEISKYIEIGFKNKVGIRSIESLTKSIIKTENTHLKKYFYKHLLEHELMMYFGTIIEGIPEIMFDKTFLSELIKNDKSRYFNICEFYSSNKKSDFVKLNQEKITNIFKYIFQEFKDINSSSNLKTGQECIFIDKHINDITNFIKNNPSHPLTCSIIEAATLSNPIFLKNIESLSPLFKSFKRPPHHDLRARQKEILINKGLEGFNPFVLNYLINFFKDDISYDLKLNIVENILKKHFKDIEFNVYKELYNDFTEHYKELNCLDFKLRIYILDDIEKTIDDYNTQISSKQNFGRHHAEINLSYDNFKERLIFLSDNIINLIDSINLYGLKYDSYLHKISETDLDSYKNYEEGLQWALEEISSRDLTDISFESVKNFFKINFFNFKEENIPLIAHIFSQYKNEDIFLEDDVQEKISNAFNPFKIESLELLRSLIQKNILTNNIQLETIIDNTPVRRRL